MAIQVSNKHLCKIFRNGTIEVVDLVGIIPMILIGGYVTFGFMCLIGCVTYLALAVLFHSDPLNIIASLDIRNISLVNGVIFAVMGVVSIGNILMMHNMLRQLIKIIKIRFP